MVGRHPFPGHHSMNIEISYEFRVVTVSTVVSSYGERYLATTHDDNLITWLYRLRAYPHASVSRYEKPPIRGGSEERLAK
jgi:hypothetical protein